MQKQIARALIAALVLPLSFFGTASVVHADSMTCPPPTPVSVDVKPGNAQNRIKLSSAGEVAVAVLTTSDFDASQFTPAMAHLSDAASTDCCTGASAVRWTLEDENADGRPDLVFFFNIQDLTLTPSSTAATLMAHGTYGSAEVHIAGSDSVQVVP